MSKDVLPDGLDWVTGSVGLLGTTASHHLMTGCDTLLTVGSNFPYSQFLPDFDQARAVQIDRSGSWIGMRYPYELNIVGDSRSTLRKLIPLLERKTDRSWREHVEERVRQWRTTAERQAMADAEPTNPIRMFHELSRRLPDSAIVTADSGSAANWYAKQPTGINVATTDEIGPAWDRALAADRPTLLDVRCDPSVPPMPPHATFDQARALAGAVAESDEDRWDVVRHTISQKAREFLPGQDGG